MTGGRTSLIWFVVVAAGIALFAGVWLVPHVRSLAEQTEVLNGLEADGRQLATRVEELTREITILLTLPREKEPVREDKRASTADTRLQTESAKRLQDVRLLSETRDRLSEATTTIEQLRGKVQALEASVSKLTEENQSLSESGADTQERLDGSARIVEAMKTELKDNSDRLVKLEGRNRTLREQSGEVRDKVARVQKLVRDLENIYRRRDDLLTGMVRRYHEVTDEYRSAVVRSASPEQRGAATGVDLSRIQNALTLAEEDLRQLRSLNARASRIGKELNK